MAESQEINSLRRRGRRRLVGAIALVLLAVIVLPMVFDSEPRQSAPPVNVRIPGEDDAGFSPKVTPKGPAAPPPATAAPAEPQKPAPAPKMEAKTEERRATRSSDKVATADAERARAETAMAGEQFVVPVAALASPEKIKELAARLAEAKLPYYTEPIATAKGQVTRVRVGPFGDRAAAEKALERLRLLGLKPGSIISKS
ncbi:MAG TPA: SPOR domain-containing protein [Burkholderiales bacterium]|nr:SPOR domain-containing protein [Burkholderiales bacterium]